MSQPHDHITSPADQQESENEKLIAALRLLLGDKSMYEICSLMECAFEGVEDYITKRAIERQERIRKTTEILQEAGRALAKTSGVAGLQKEPPKEWLLDDKQI